MTVLGEWAARILGVRDLGAVANQPLDEAPFVVLDTELTGLDAGRDEILAIGAVRMLGGRILLGETFDRLVRPARSSWGNTVPIHRIRPSDVANAPPLEDVLPSLAEFCRGRIMVAHVARVDRSFLARRLHGAETHVLSGPWLDTSRVAAWLAADGGRLPHLNDPAEFLDLAELARRYDIEPASAHEALVDAFLTAQIWQRQVFQLAEHGVATLRDAFSLGRG